MKFQLKQRQFSRVASALSLLLLAGSARAEVISGVVINGTNNDRPQAGVPVQIVRPGFEKEPTVILANTKTDAAGRFSVNPSGLRKDDLLTARIPWQGFTYEIPAYDPAGQLKQFGLETVKADALSLTIFDGSTTAPPLSFTVHHVAIATMDRDLKCVERIVVENPSLRTFVGEGPQKITLKLNLPAGAQGVELDPKIRSGKLVKLGNEYGISLPITPQKYDNRNAVIINYTLPWKRGGIDLSRKLNYPTSFFFMAREEKDKKLIITAPELGIDENQSLPIDGENAVRIVNKKGPSQDGKPVFAAGTEVAMNVSRPTNPLVWAFIGFLAVLALIVPLTFIRTRTPAGEASKGAVKSVEPGSGRSVSHGHYNTTSEAVIAEISGSGTALAIPMLNPELKDCLTKIAQLDDEWEAGTIARVPYQEQRAALKNKALQLLTAHSAGQSGQN